MYNQYKLDLLIALQQELDRMRERSIASAKESQEEANYHVGAMESRYDTFKEEAQYLTEAQKLRLLYIQGQIQSCKQLTTCLLDGHIRFTRLQTGALAQILPPEGQPLWVFIAPAGLNLQQHFNTLGLVTCVTEETPLVCKGIGLEVGEEYEVYNNGQQKWYEIVSII